MLHDCMAQVFGAFTRSSTDFKDRTAPLELLQQHLFCDWTVIFGKKIDFVDYEPTRFFRELRRKLLQLFGNGAHFVCWLDIRVQRCDIDEV